MIFRETIDEGITKNKICLELIDLLICRWFIENNLYYFLKKSEYLNIFLTIKKCDQIFYSLLKKCFPLNFDNSDYFKKTFKYLQSVRDHFQPLCFIFKQTTLIHEKIPKL